MISMILSSLIAAFLAFATFMAAWALRARSLRDREKSSPFECGFDPKNTARIPFSLRFFLLGIIFIIFDIEIVLLIPLPLLNKTSPILSSYCAAFIFIFILIAGLLHEWREGSLNWTS